MKVISSREERGLALVKGKAKAFRRIATNTIFIPSATHSGGYVVDVAAGTCSCPDWEENRGTCKHQFAARFFNSEQPLPTSNTLVTEKIRLVYSQDWPRYNRAQEHEKDHVQFLLRGLCDGIEEPPQTNGRPRLPLSEAVFSAGMKIYSTLSTRRSMSDLRACGESGHLKRVPAVATVFKYMEKPELLPILKRLVAESARPLIPVETKFAIDSTGLATQCYVRYFDYAHGNDRRVQKWIKVHACIGVLTNVACSIDITEGHVGDSTMFSPLIERTAANGFKIDEVSADKAYLSHANLAKVEQLGGRPYIPFKVNSASTGSAAWERLWHLCEVNMEEFKAKYHRRSNVESFFSSVKRLTGENLRSRTQAAQYNEAALKVLMTNLTLVTHSIYELGIEPKFWLPRGGQ
jgi:transposase